MIKDILWYKDLQETENFDFLNPQTDPVQLSIDLTETMLSRNGIGLAACQIGINLNVCVIAAEQVLAMFNPTIVDASTETILLDEGCLSIPDIVVKVRRPKHIKVRYTRPNGETVTEKYTGMTARIIQHEIAHLNHRTMLDDASIVQKEAALKKIKKLKRKENKFD